MFKCILHTSVQGSVGKGIGRLLSLGVRPQNDETKSTAEEYALNNFLHNMDAIRVARRRKSLERLVYLRPLIQMPQILQEKLGKHQDRMAQIKVSKLNKRLN